MHYTDNALNIITTKTYKGIGRAWIVRNLEGGESIERIVEKLNTQSKRPQPVSIDDFFSKREAIAKTFTHIQAHYDGLIAMGDPEFPRHRGSVKDGDRPIYLFYKGDLRLLQIDRPAITVIGLLDPDETIANRERTLVDAMVEQEITIVSGLAAGCDSIAHQQAIQGGKTVAILPSPLHAILPAKHHGLANEIVERGGLLISEYYEDFKSRNELNSRYVERDRLQALFCDAIVLVASYAPDSAKRWGIHDRKLDSGARLAMEDAGRYAIPRAVMYHPQTDHDNPMFDLNRTLIAEDRSITILTPKTLNEMIAAIKRNKRLPSNRLMGV